MMFNREDMERKRREMEQALLKHQEVEQARIAAKQYAAYMRIGNDGKITETSDEPTDWAVMLGGTVVGNLLTKKTEEDAKVLSEVLEGLEVKPMKQDKPKEPEDMELEKANGHSKFEKSIIGLLLPKLIEEMRQPAMDHITDLVKNEKPVRLEVALLGEKGVDVGVTHKQFPILLKILAQGLHPFLVGPAGGGKTMAAWQAAKALSMEFGAISVGPQTTQSQIIGYMDAQGRYVRSQFRERFENGGVYLFDEIDAGNAAVLTCINAALSGEVFAFPDGMIKKSEKFLCIASGNTYGKGIDRVYVGRNELDGASLDRFVVVDWPYDESLEKTFTQNKKWLESVLATRKAIMQLDIRHIVSPRATIHGTKLIDAGLPFKDVCEMVLLKGLSPDDKKRIAKVLTEMAAK